MCMSTNLESPRLSVGWLAPWLLDRLVGDDSLFDQKHRHAKR